MYHGTKHPKQYRLSEEVIKALAWLAKRDNVSQTAALERSVLDQLTRKKVPKKIQNKQGLLKFAGILSEEEADEMLDLCNEFRSGFVMRDNPLGRVQ